MGVIMRKIFVIGIVGLLIISLIGVINKKENIYLKSNYVSINYNYKKNSYRKIIKENKVINVKKEVSNNDNKKIEEDNNIFSIDIINIYNTYKEEINASLALVNDLRMEAGSKPLVLDEKLSLLATVRAMEIANSKVFEHIRPNGEKVETLLNSYNIKYHYFGENIAKGYFSAEDVVEAWKNSAGHYRNMINNNFEKIGIGKIIIDNRCYWVQFIIA